MTTTQQPEALVFADNRPTSLSDDLYQWAIDAEDLILAQHARIEELEAQLSAIGAGGVEPLRKQAAVPQGWKLVPEINELCQWFNEGDGCSPDNCCGRGPNQEGEKE